MKLMAEIYEEMTASDENDSLIADPASFPGVLSKELDLQARAT